MWPFSKSVAAALRGSPSLAPEVLEAGILALNGTGVQLAVLYATMNGFEHGLLNSGQAIEQFLELAQSEPAFSDIGIAKAVERVVQGADAMCAGSAFETFVYGLENTENQHLKPLLEPFRVAVRRFGAAQVFASSGFDVGAFIIRTSIERRAADLGNIFTKLDEKRLYLAPLLMRARARGRNKYGDPDYNEFFEELLSFLQTYFNQNNLGFFHTYYPLTLCFQHVEPWLADAADALAMPIDGIDFEHWCAARLEEQGWSVRVSKASGDQGIDIEAMRDGLLVAIQCKRYTQPIGNKCVQEAFTGATHYRAQRAVVIGTGGYTKAAIELAQNTGVILLDAENIASFTDLMLDA